MDLRVLESALKGAQRSPYPPPFPCATALLNALMEDQGDSAGRTRRPYPPPFLLSSSAPPRQGPPTCPQDRHRRTETNGHTEGHQSTETQRPHHRDILTLHTRSISVSFGIGTFTNSFDGGLMMGGDWSGGEGATAPPMMYGERKGGFRVGKASVRLRRGADVPRICRA